MNKINLSQRLNARMHFKSLLLVPLLVGSASAQQSPMPTLVFELPTVESVPATEFVEAEAEALRSAWTMRQHATWLLGLKPRQVMSHAVDPFVPAVPRIDFVSTADALVPMPVAPETRLPKMSANDVMLVQHTEPVAATVQSQGEARQVETTHRTIPQNRPSLGPVVSGPVPALPLERLTGESLLQVDVSGVDAAKLNTADPQAESLIDGIVLPAPVGFSMRDDETASVAASPSRAKPVSVHEGFAPRVSTANQATRLSGGSQSPSSERLSTSLPRASGSQFSISDETDVATGPVLNQLSDQKTVHAKLEDRAGHANVAGEHKPVEKSFSDKNSLLASVPVEVSNDTEKTSRSGKPVVLTPPIRLAQESPRALPLSSALPIASTSADRDVPHEAELAAEAAKFLGKTQPQSTEKMVATDKPSESLIENLIPWPSASPATETKVVSKKPESKATPSRSTDKPTKVDSFVTKAPQPKPERAQQSDSNPLAMKRPVVKAASVAIPEVAEPESVVIQSSHAMDDTSLQIAEYAKMAAKMQQAVKQKFPNVRVKITCNEDGLVVDGNLANNVEASKILSFVRKTSLCPVADRVTTSQ